MCAAASHLGFVHKWSLRAGEENLSIEAVLEGTAHRPWVYRQLIPALANYADTLIPPELKRPLIRSAAFKNHQIFGKIPETESLHFRVSVVYYLHFCATLAGMAVLAALLRHLGIEAFAAVVTPPLFYLLIPYLQTVGGYYYDNVELFFLLAATVAAARGWLVLLVAVAALGTLNKESFLWFVPSLAPLLATRWSRQRTIVALAILGAVYAGLAHTLHTVYSANPGTTAILQVRGNLERYASPGTYFLIEHTYAVPGPEGFNLLTLAILAIPALHAWPQAAAPIRLHLLIAAAVSAPLFLLFCHTGELRNLSFLYPGFAVLTALYIQSFLHRSAPLPGTK
jgi:hypothetical protein